MCGTLRRNPSGAFIAASGGFISIAVAIGMSVWRAREAKKVETYGSARWAEKKEVEAAGLLGPDRLAILAQPRPQRVEFLAMLLHHVHQLLRVEGLLRPQRREAGQQGGFRPVCV